MGVSTKWDPDSRIWTLTVSEEFGFGEIAELIDAVDWKGGKRFLWDLRRLKSGPDSTPELHRAVDLLEETQPLWSGSRAAILVERDFDYGIARMFGVFAERIDVTYSTFRDEESALDWLQFGSEEEDA